MATYSFNETLTRPLDRVRAALQDKGEEVDEETGGPFWELSDELILAQLGLHTFREAVAQMASDLATKYAKIPDTFDEGTGGLKISFKNLVARYEKIAEEYRNDIAEVAGDQGTHGAILGRIVTADHAISGLRFGCLGRPARPLDGRLPYGGRGW